MQHPLIIGGLLLLSAAASAADEVVYDNTDPSSYQDYYMFVPDGGQAGDQITLGPGSRAINLFTVTMGSSEIVVVADYTLRFYENDGPGGTPGTILHEQTLFDQLIGGGVVFEVTIPIPEVVVPDTFTWAMQVDYHSFPGTIAIISFDPITIGSSDDFTWGFDYGGSPGWSQNGAPSGFVANLGARIWAVEGPPGTSFCFGDGSGASCPCGNTGGTGEGCANSTIAGGILTTGGSRSVAADDMLFFANGLLANKAALLFSGANAVNGGLGSPFGDGLRCAGGSTLRHGIAVPDANGAAAWPPGLASSAGWNAGDTRHFQVWYRDIPASLCGTGFNTTQGITVVLTP